MSLLNRYAGTVFCILRIIVGLLFASHGGQLALGLFGGMPNSNNPMSQTGGWIQLLGGLLIAFGLFTRAAAFLSSGTMAVAYFMFHVANAATLHAKFFPIATAGPQYSNKGELAVLYCFVFFYIIFHGPGWLSLDALIWRNKTAATNERV